VQGLAFVVFSPRRAEPSRAVRIDRAPLSRGVPGVPEQCPTAYNQTMPDATTLFPALAAEQVAASRALGPFAGVALEQGIDRVLDYAVPKRLVTAIQVGQRVRVPLGRGNKSTTGYVVRLSETSDFKDPSKIKPLTDIADERVLVPPKLMELARWMSRYYVAPLGTVLESVIPSAVKKKVGVGYRQMVRLLATPEAVQELIEKTKAKKRRAILGRLLQIEPGQAVEINALAGEAGTKPPTIRKLAHLGLIAISSEVDLPNFSGQEPSPIAPGGTEVQENPPNEDQQRVLDDLIPRVKQQGFSVNLLLGVTGSGKTEVYLRCIRQVVALGKQAIVLVPEIALTPQTVRRFTARFPAVAVLHSGLTATQRHKFWQQIATGRASVVVGARSAVFAPVPSLGIIVVDEEHEASYKQDTAPRYQGRDVAIKRAQLEGVPILLGSATPSLETYYKALRSKAPVGATQVSPPQSYHLLSLPNRVRGLSLPHVELVDMKTEARMRRGVHLMSTRLEYLLKHTIDTGHQAILLLNRRGYSNFVYCASCANVIQCKYCDTTMTFHRSAGVHATGATAAEGAHTGQLHCHYCLAVNPLPEHCPACRKKLSLFGLGTQRVEEEVARKFPDLRFARVDSDSMHGAKDYEALLGRFAKREIQVLLGTQMIAKGLDYPNVTLVGVISGDTALSLPDFRAAERTFQLITQVAGRAGRGDNPGRVVLQTFQPEDTTIQAAVKQDFVRFAESELKGRRDVGLPPFARLVRIVIREQDPEKLNTICDKLAAALSDAVAAAAADGSVRVKGPMPCAISRIAGYFRNQVVLTSERADRLQRVLAHLRQGGHLSKADRVAVDVDPVSLL